MKVTELKGDAYIVYFDDNEELNYQLCNQLLRELRWKFPGKKFIGMLKGIEFKDLSDEDVSNLIEMLKEIQEQRLSAALTEPSVEEVVEEKEEKGAD
jgi:transcription initiation factor IIE alpha subunit